jgi:methionyl aminopeptidase
VDAARSALEAAIALAGAGRSVRDLSAAIDAAIRARGYRSVANLCGHGVGRWTVHGPPPIPNVPDRSPDLLSEGQVIAIEPFATDGVGRVVERGRPEVFRLEGDGAAPGVHGDVMDAIHALRGLPFARRQLAGFAQDRVESTLRALRAAGRLAAYPPLVDAAGRRISQAEHTVFVGRDGAEVLTA